jgi:hypothetical protein
METTTASGFSGCACCWFAFAELRPCHLGKYWAGDADLDIAYQARKYGEEIDFSRFVRAKPAG